MRQIAFVTGASSGIGRACAGRLVREGHREGESPEYECHVCSRKFNWP